MKKKCGFQGTRIINERLAGTGHVIRKFGFHPVSEKQGEVLTEENGMIRSVFQRYHFTGSCKREAEDGDHSGGHYVSEEDLEGHYVSKEGQEPYMASGNKSGEARKDMRVNKSLDSVTDWILAPEGKKNKIDKGV